VATALSAAGDFAVVEEAADTGEALQTLRRTAVDFVVTEVRLGGGASGLDLVRSTRVEHPAVGVLVLASGEEVVYGPRALRAGAHGFVSKSRSPQALVEALRAVRRGEAVVSEDLRTRIAQQASRGAAELLDPTDALTDRELEVFGLIGGGLSTREVAAALHLSPKTVETYRRHIKQKLRIASPTALVRHAALWVHYEGEDGVA
jgi:DNA-binding NarL/FixJ family response regulator